MRPGIATVLLVALLAAPAAAELPDQEAPVTGIDFASAEAGLAVTAAGLVMTTTDGGQSWYPVDSVHHPLAGIAMVDRRVALAVGGHSAGPGLGSVGLILKTTDGGHSWHNVGPPTVPRFWGISVRDHHAAAWCESGPGAPAGLLISDNEGETWTPVDGRLDQPIIALNRTATDAGYALSADGVAWHWHDGRIDRLPGQSPPGNMTAAAILAPESYVAALDDGRFVTSRDGGRSWQRSSTPQPLGGVGARTIQFVSPTDGWAAGVGPVGLVLTDDAGRSWHPAASIPAGPLHAARFTDLWHGVVAGPFGTLWHTVDGGQSWRCALGSERRAALAVVEPYAAAADWTLVSMLSADRGYRTVIWWATRPTAEPIIVTERRLRDAAAKLAEAEAIVLSPYPSSRIDGPPGFSADGAVPHRPFNVDGPGRLTAILADAVRRWQPAAVLATSETSPDAEQQFVGRAAADALEGTPVSRWTADPANRTGDRPPGIESPFGIAIDPLTASEEYGELHGVRAAEAARLARRWPLPVAESLGYRRVASAVPDPFALVLLEDLGDNAITRRPVAAAARVSLERRREIEQAARDFLGPFHALLAAGETAAAARRADQFSRTTTSALGRAAMAELLGRAAIDGRMPLATDVARNLALLPAKTESPSPWPIDATLWQLDVAASMEWRRGNADLAPDLQTSDAALVERLHTLALSDRPGLAMCDSLRWQRWRVTSAAAPTGEAFERFAATLSDPAVVRMADLERWLAGDRRGDPPCPAVRFDHPPPAGGAEVTRGGEQDKPDAGQGGVAVPLDENTEVEVAQQEGRLIFRTSETAARGLDLALDVDRDGRTLLVAPFTAAKAEPADSAAPAASQAPAVSASAAAPVWFRRPAVWQRETKDGRAALALVYDAFGGRPAAGSAWVVSLRRRPAEGARDEPVAADAGFFVIIF